MCESTCPRCKGDMTARQLRIQKVCNKCASSAHNKAYELQKECEIAQINDHKKRLDSLPYLTGSVKQIQWATDIILNNADKIFSAADRGDALAKLTLRAKNAKWIIDNRCKIEAMTGEIYND